MLGASLAWFLCLFWLLSGCALRQPAPQRPPVPPYHAPEGSPTSAPPKTEATPIWKPPLGASWQIQYSGDLDASLNVDIYNLDLFDTPVETIAALHARGVHIMCYFSAGSFEDWRPDANRFPSAVLGNDLEGWPGERWLDIRQREILDPIMQARLDSARENGCDGVDPDNVNGYTQPTGFPLTYRDQLEYNLTLAKAAHARGLSIGLKNDLDQVPDLLPYFDWALNEECFFYGECDLLIPFIAAGKPVFNIEYELQTADFCPQAQALGFNSVRKNLALDAFVEPCH